MDIKKFSKSSNPAGIGYIQYTTATDWLWAVCNIIDVVMDMLGSEESSLAILDYYNSTNENEMVIKAIEEATFLRSPSELSHAAAPKYGALIVSFY